MVKNLSTNAGDTGLIPAPGRFQGACPGAAKPLLPNKRSQLFGQMGRAGRIAIKYGADGTGS